MLPLEYTCINCSKLCKPIECIEYTINGKFGPACWRCYFTHRYGVNEFETGLVKVQCAKCGYELPYLIPSGKNGGHEPKRISAVYAEDHWLEKDGKFYCPKCR